MSDQLPTGVAGGLKAPELANARNGLVGRAALELNPLLSQWDVRPLGRGRAAS